MLYGLVILAAFIKLVIRRSDVQKSCGVFHFIPGSESTFAEDARLRKHGTQFAFITRFPTADLPGELYIRLLAGILRFSTILDPASKLCLNNPR